MCKCISTLGSCCYEFSRKGYACTMNAKKCLKSLTARLCMALSVMFLFTNFVCHAESPSVVSGRILGAGEKTEDNSNWIEIARYRNCSLIIRVDPISNRMCFDDSGKYCGYSDSNAQREVNRWFDSMKETSILKKYAVGSTAFTNLGCFGELNESRNVYESLRGNEAMGDGVSLPLITGDKHVFLLSYQEAKKYISYEGGDIRNEVLMNYNLFREHSLRGRKLILDN